jgi:hypothetical protein
LLKEEEPLVENGSSQNSQIVDNMMRKGNIHVWHLAAFIVGSNIVNGLSSCDQFNLYTNASQLPYSYALITSNSKNFTQARTACSQMHSDSDLIILRDSAVFGIFTEVAFRAWVGISQSNKSVEPYGNWFWIDGLPLPSHYVQWNYGEPNNADGVEDCASMLFVQGYNDENCANQMSYICEVNGNSESIFQCFDPF